MWPLLMQGLLSGLGGQGGEGGGMWSKIAGSLGFGNQGGTGFNGAPGVLPDKNGQGAVQMGQQQMSNVMNNVQAPDQNRLNASAELYRQQNQEAQMLPDPNMKGAKTVSGGSAIPGGSFGPPPAPQGGYTPVSQTQMIPSAGAEPPNPGMPGFGSLFNMTGTMQNPNALLKGGVGYNQGGLLGALGAMLTDMNMNSPQNKYDRDLQDYQNRVRVEQNRKQY